MRHPVQLKDDLSSLCQFFLSSTGHMHGPTSEDLSGCGLKMFDLLNRRDERMGGDLTTNCLLQVPYHIKYLKVTWFTTWIKLFLTCMDIFRSKPASQLVFEFL